MRLGPTALFYLLRRQSGGLLLRWLCLHLALCLPALCFALLQEPQLLALAPLEIAGHVFIEVGPSSLLVGLPLCCALVLIRLRADGDLTAMSSLQMRPFCSRLVLLLGILPFLFLHGLWLNAAKPNQRLGRHSTASGLPSPDVLVRMLPRFVSGLGRVGIAYELADESALLEVQLLAFETQTRYIRLEAKRMELRQRESDVILVFRDGKAVRGELAIRSRLQERALGFELLEVSVARGQARTRGTLPAESLATSLIEEHAATILARAARLDPDPQRRLERKQRYTRELNARQLEQWGLTLGCLLAVFMCLGATASLRASSSACEVLSCCLPLLLAFSLRPILMASLADSGIAQFLPPAACALLVAGIFVRRP